MSGPWPFAFLATVALFSLAGPALAQEPLASSNPPATSLLEPLVFPPAGDATGGLTLAGLKLTAEFLYLWPNRDGLGMAVVTNNRGNGTLTYSSLTSLAWDGTPAFRVGASYLLPESLVELGAAFTYFHARTQTSVAAPDGGSLQGLLASDYRAQNATAADGDAGLNYAILDLDAARSVSISDALGLRVFGGVRLASINQSLKCIYTGGALGNAADYVNSPVHFLGAGLTAGAETTWKIYQGWGLYGRGRVGLISGSFSSSQTETVGTTLINEESERYYTIIPVVEMGPLA